MRKFRIFFFVNLNETNVGNVFDFYGAVETSIACRMRAFLSLFVFSANAFWRLLRLLCAPERNWIWLRGIKWRHHRHDIQRATRDTYRFCLFVFFFLFVCVFQSIHTVYVGFIFSLLFLCHRAHTAHASVVLLCRLRRNRSPWATLIYFFFLFALNPCVCSCVIWLLTCFDSFMMSFAWRMRIWSWFIWCFHLFIFHSAICFYSFLCVRKWSQICVRDWVRCCVVVCQFEWKRDRRWNWQNKTWQDGVLRN